MSSKTKRGKSQAQKDLEALKRAKDRSQAELKAYKKLISDGWTPPSK